MLCRYVDLIADAHLPMSMAKTTYKDDDKIAAFAKPSVGFLSQAGVLTGKDNSYFTSTVNVTRAECAKIIAIISRGIMEGKTLFW